jgi:phage baseplate assembly protein W
VLDPNALVVTPSQVEKSGEVISTGLAEETGDSLNKYGEDILRSLALRQAGAASKNFGRFTGPAYQFGPSWALTLGPKTDVEVVFTSVVNVLTTPIGSVPYDPFLGSEVANLVFEPNDAVTQGLLRYFVDRDLRRQEPRANVLFVRTVVPDNEPHTVVVTVAFQIVGDPEGRVFSAPIEFNTLSLAG